MCIRAVFAWAVNFVGSFFGESVTVHVTASKEDCLAKLVQYDMIAAGLPVGLGGSWTGGCEPWRKGSLDGDELHLEIETDLACLFRTILWCHEQTVVANQQASLSSSSTSSLSPSSPPPPPHQQHLANTAPINPQARDMPSIAEHSSSTSTTVASSAKRQYSLSIANAMQTSTADVSQDSRPCPNVDNVVIHRTAFTATTTAATTTTATTEHERKKKKGQIVEKSVDSKVKTPLETAVALPLSPTDIKRLVVAKEGACKSSTNDVYSAPHD
jgi:hypothetical protein